MNTDISPSLMENGLDAAEQKEAEADIVNAPFDPAAVDIESKKFSITTLLARLTHSELELTPEFQRRHNLWDDERKSRLIESILLRIPLPSFYFREDDKGNFVVVDGLQRMCAIFHFVEPETLNKFTKTKLPALRLKGLQYLKELEDKSFEELDRPRQRRINELEIEANIIRASTPDAVMFNVFARLNQGNLPLTAQEIRNAIYKGEWRDQVREMAESRAFLHITESRVPTERQEDMEMVLRFVALLAIESPESRKPEQALDTFLNETVQNILNKWQKEHWDLAQKEFYKGLDACKRLFGAHAFRKSTAPSIRTPINKGLFEAQMIALISFDSAQLDELVLRCDAVISRFADEVTHGTLKAAIGYGTGYGYSSNARIKEMRALLQGVLNA